MSDHIIRLRIEISKYKFFAIPIGILVAQAIMDAADNGRALAIVAVASELAEEVLISISEVLVNGVGIGIADLRTGLAPYQGSRKKLVCFAE
jgi:hypothetical protein